MNKSDALGELQRAWSSCRGCGLCEQRNSVVFGYGNPYAQVMVIGEAPGETEDRTGLPFVGAAGQLLDQYLGYTSIRDDVKELVEIINRAKSNQKAGSERRDLRNLLLDEFYFTNVVMCRPPENRDPIPKEIEACRTRLFEQIYLVDPILIVTAGRIATEALLGKKVTITSARGEMFDIEIPGRIQIVRYPVIAVLHPSYLLRKNDFRQKGGDGVKTYNDFIRSMNVVDRYNEIHYGTPTPSSRPKMEK
jgi:uracil-DNA glycosylase family 4